jgi:hypothetical protein
VGWAKLAYGEEKLEVPVLLLKRVDGFKVTKETLFIPWITRVMDLFVSPFIGKEDLSGIWSDVGERIKNMSGTASQRLAFLGATIGPLREVLRWD